MESPFQPFVKNDVLILMAKRDILRYSQSQTRLQVSPLNYYSALQTNAKMPSHIIIAIKIIRVFPTVERRYYSSMQNDTLYYLNTYITEKNITSNRCIAIRNQKYR